MNTCSWGRAGAPQRSTRADRRPCRHCWSPVTPSRQAGCPTEARPTSASVVLTASKAEPSSGQVLRPSGLPPPADGAPSPTRQAQAGAGCGPWERAENRPGGGTPSPQAQQRHHRPTRTSGPTWRPHFPLTPCSAGKQGGSDSEPRSGRQELKVQLPTC